MARVVKPLGAADAASSPRYRQVVWVGELLEIAVCVWQYET